MSKAGCYSWIVFLTFISSFSFSTQAEKYHLSVVTESAHSLQFKSKETGKMQGPAAELVEKVIHAAGIDFTTKVLPWARAYKEAQVIENTLIYSIVRTPERESKFHWIGVISKPQYYLFAKKDSTFINNKGIDSFKHYRIATILNSASYLTLEAEGFNSLIPLTHPTQLFEMLNRDRVDFITANKRTFQSICEFYSVKCESIVAVAPIKMPKNSSLYFAMNKDSDLAIIERLKATYQKLLSTGEIAIF